VRLAKTPRRGYSAPAMFFLTPRHVKLGRQFVKDAKKLLNYKRDLVTGEVIAEVEKEIASLDAAVKTRQRPAIEAQAGVLDKVCGKLVQPTADAGWRENVEVFLVAIVVALGVRTYYLQPFTIPTSSMFPTLNGIIFHETKEALPNVLLRPFMVPIFGRHYVDFVAEERERVIGLRPSNSPLPFIAKTPGVNAGPFTRTEVVTRSESGRERSYFVTEAPETMGSQFPQTKWGNHIYEPGEPILRGYFDAGDHVFVDKFSYHFRKPRRSEIFVFSTADIPMIKQRSTTSQYYIKRLGGTPGDTLQVRPPELFINGKRAEEPGFNRVMTGTLQHPHDGYRGYGNGVAQEGYDQAVYVQRLNNLSEPDATFTLPPHEYFALGDNSFNSWDSRGWGTVPEKSIMGRALVVYWPFWPHFGLSK
jgi:signal peptidase I